MSHLGKKFIVLLILTSFLAVVLFSFAFMMHESDGRMVSDCPFTTMGVSLCPQDIAFVALHHISAYNSFLNVPVGAGLIVSIVSMLFASYAILFIFKRSSLPGPPIFSNNLNDSSPPNSYTSKIHRWLSLFENSPSLI